MGGRPHVITEQNKRTVEIMSGLGSPQEFIAKAIGCSRSCLMDHYRGELDAGIAKANQSVSQHMFALATLKEKNAKGEITDRPDPRSANAGMFWLRARAGWRDSNRVEVSGPDGGPIQTVDLTKLSDEQLAALEPVLAALVEQSGSGRSDSDDASANPIREGETRH